MEFDKEDKRANSEIFLVRQILTRAATGQQGKKSAEKLTYAIKRTHLTDKSFCVNQYLQFIAQMHHSESDQIQIKSDPAIPF